jgi:putative peptidoglycan lipid II flippase
MIFRRLPAFMASKHQMLRSSMVVGFFTFLGSLTGILIETSIAAKLGLSKSSDTFYAAYTIPYIITNLLYATGQFSLVPFFAALETRYSPEELWRGFSYSVNVIFLGLGAFAAVGAAASPGIIRGIAPGFTRPQIELATQLSQWLFLMILPAGVAEVFRSFLLSHHYFALPSASGFFRNATVIVAVLYGFNRYGAYSIVLGYMAGYFLQLLILAAQILRCFRVRYSLTLVATGEAFRNLRGAGAAQLAAAAGWQGVVIVERIIASFLPAGTLTALNYGYKILATLAELLSGSVGTAALPALSRAVAHQAWEEERRTFRDTIEISLVLLLPMTVFCLMLNHSIIRLVFQRGNFTAEATALMAMVFFYYSLSLLPFSFIRLFSFYLFARNQPGVYFRISTLYYGLVVIFDLTYVGMFRMGAKGIPLGLLTGSFIASVVAMRKNLGDVHRVLDRPLALFTAKNLAGGLLAAFTIEALRFWIPAPLSGGENFLYLCELCGSGSLVYLAALALLRAFPIPQLAAIWSSPDDS